VNSVDISVIVPVYNVEKYFPRCLESLKLQSYRKIEFILVDDGSPDNSPVMSEEIALEDDRFCVIHKPNGGQSRARNTAIGISSGKCISFVDSDDYVINEPFEYAFKLIVSENADIVTMENLCGDDGEQVKKEQGIDDKTEKLTSYEVYNKLCMRAFSDSPWNKLFRRDLFENQYFDEGVLNEDFLLLVKLLKKKPSILTSNYIGYYYFLHAGSTTGSGFKKNMIDALYNAHFAYRNIPSLECKKSATEYFLYKILMFLVNMPIEYIKDNNDDYLFAYKNLKKLRKKINKTTLSLRDRTLLNMFCICPRITKKIVDKYMKGRA